MASEAPLCYRVRVTGRVQGVWFRSHTQDKARQLGVKGWVKNEADGAVIFLACGAPDRVAALCEWAKAGPPLAKVDKVDMEATPFESNHEDFVVR